MAKENIFWGICLKSVTLSAFIPARSWATNSYSIHHRKGLTSMELISQHESKKEFNKKTVDLLSSRTLYILPNSTCTKEGLESEFPLAQGCCSEQRTPALVPGQSNNPTIKQSG